MRGPVDFQRVFEDTPEVSLLLDGEATVLAASDRYLAAVGCVRPEVVGRSLLALPPYATAPRSVERLRTALGALVKSGVAEPHDLPDAGSCASGARFLSATNVPIHDGEGRLLGVHHRMLSAAAPTLAQPDRERELRKLFESSCDAIALVDAYGRFVFITPSVRNVLGYGEEEYIAAPPMALVHPDDVPRFGAELNRLFTQPGGLLRTRLRERHRDGTYRTLEGACVNRLHDPDVAALVVTFRDVTEQVRLQEELRLSHDQLRVALNAAHALSWTWDIESRRFTFSEDFAAFFGLPAGSYPRPDEAAQAVHPDDRELVRGEISRCLATGEEFRVEYRGPERQQDTRWYASHGQVFRDGGGRALQMVGVTWDVTRRRRLERERELLDRRIQESQKLESLGVLAGGIAHDFNNILTAILGNATLTRTALDEDAGARAFVAQIEEGAQRAAELCRQMLAYAGKGQFVLGPGDLNRLVEGALHLLELSISGGISLRRHLKADLPAALMDDNKIRQVLTSFVMNAADAIGEGAGEISVSTGVVMARRTYLDGLLLGQEIPEGEYVVLEVRDTGRGMNAEMQARIFEPFYSTKFAGRGLGLAVALGIVRGHKGALEVHSEPGQGSRFKLLLPVSRVQADPAPAPAGGAPLAGGGTILVVDDEQSVRTVATTMLERLGFQALAAASGREGLELFRRHGKDLAAVLLDLTMPGLGGEEVVRALRALDPSVRVLIMSGYDERQEVARFAGGGPAGFLQKPFGLDDLREGLRVLLG